MVERSQLIVVSITGFWITTMQILGELEHVVGVAGLRTVDVVDEIHTGFLAGEVLTTRVPAKSE